MNKLIESSIKVNLPLSVYKSPLGQSDAYLLFEALQDYLANLAKHTAIEHENGSEEDAASFWHDYQAVANLQRLVFQHVSALAFENCRKADPIYAINEATEQGDTEKILADYRKFFGVSIQDSSSHE